jgi:hypothetical protein
LEQFQNPIAKSLEEAISILLTRKYNDRSLSVPFNKKWRGEDRCMGLAIAISERQNKIEKQSILRNIFIYVSYFTCPKL